jgi:succinate dehydrogenase/fumarate reductase flavoprotein subunit
LGGAPTHPPGPAPAPNAGARPALNARGATPAAVDAAQLAREKQRAYAPLACGHEGPDWKELNAASARVMQNYCGELKNGELLAIGAQWLDDLEANEAPRVGADNPHQLMRVLEVHDILTCSQMIVAACQARKASSTHLHFERIDYPQMDAPEWRKWVVIRKHDGQTAVSDRPIAFWGEYEANYRPRHAENEAAMKPGSVQPGRGATGGKG